MSASSGGVWRQSILEKGGFSSAPGEFVVVWDPHLQKDIDKLERVQRSAARFIAGNYRTRTPGFVTKILDHHQLPTLQQRREDLRLTLYFKIVKGLVPAIPPQTILTPAYAGRIRKTTRSNDFIYQTSDKTPKITKTVSKSQMGKLPNIGFPSFQETPSLGMPSPTQW